MIQTPSRASTVSAQVVVQNVPIRKGQICDKMPAMKNLTHREVRDATVRMRHKVKARRPSPGAFLDHILQLIAHQLRDLG
jgi:hypothetical protein